MQVNDKEVARAPRQEASDLSFRPEGSFRIKDSLKKMAQAQPAAKVQQQEAVKHEQVASRTAFSQQQVIHALENYLNKHVSEPTISIAIRSHKPLVEGEKIVVLADNQLQLDKLGGIRQQILNFLMRFLENGFIQLEFTIFDNNSNHQEKKKLFTSGEKFEHFTSLNPVVADLKVIFGLELE